MSRAKYGEGSIFLRKDGRWEGRITIGTNDNGNPKTKSVLAKTKTECQEKLKKLKEECGRRNDRMKPDMMFGDWLDLWYQYYSKPKLRPTTRACYEDRIYKHIIPEIGRIPLNKLTQSDLQQFYARLKRGGRIRLVEELGEGLSDRAVRGCHTTCRSSLERAVKEGLIRSNPTEACKLPPKKSKEMQILTKEEIIRFLTQAEAEGYYEMFMLELTTGMRRGELLALKWRDLNINTGELHISRQVTKPGKETLISAPKTKSSIRSIILPLDMVELLVDLKKRTKGEWMFPSPVNEGEPRNPTAVFHRFQLILERANCKRIRFHDLRHTFATIAIENGMDIKTLSNMIGHISAETTLNIYSHITDTMQAQAAVKIDRKIGGADAEMPKIEEKAQTAEQIPKQTEFTPYTGKIRKSGTGCITMINENLYEGRFTPRVNGKRISKNVYAKTREECEQKLAELIKTMKSEIAAEKKKAKQA